MLYIDNDDKLKQKSKALIAQDSSREETVFTASVVRYTGVTLIAKNCVNIVFCGCHTHFRHIPASLYTKWLI